LKNTNTAADASLLTNRLVINGRLYSFNTRGGSIVVNGSSLSPASGTLGKFFNNTTLTSTTATTIKKAYEQDLERFRMILNDGNTTCSLSVNYQLLSMANLPQILQRPMNFT
jgi:hypothetical protein